LEEALNLYRFNCFCKTFEVQGPADRTLVYLQLHISDCLLRLPPEAQSAAEGLKALRGTVVGDNGKTLIPGDTDFPIPSFPAPSTPAEAIDLRTYLGEARSELTARLLMRVFDYAPPPEVDPNVPGSKPSPQSPWWIGFAKRRFLNKSLCP
jgi:actin related protein 2/3 complex subunit 3